MKTYTRDTAPDALKSIFDKPRFVPLIFTSKGFDPKKAMTIQAIANLAQEDRCGELIPPEAWDLENYLKNPIVLLEHNRQKPIGYCTSIEIRKEGLFFEACIGDPSLAPLTADQEYARSLLAQGILKACSVGFIPHEIVYDEDLEVIRYNKAELLENSLVSVPMQQDSLVTSVKNFGGNTVAKEYSTADIHGAVKEAHDATKAMHKDMTAMHKDMADSFKEFGKKPKDDSGDDDGDGDGGKSLKQQLRKAKQDLTVAQANVITLTAERDALKSDLEATQKDAEALLTKLQELNVIPKAT